MAENSGKKSANAAKAEARKERLAEALRANLRRRKGQKKARADETEGEEALPLNPNHGADGQDGP